MAFAYERAGAGAALLGVFQFVIAFIVSSCVALGGTDSVFPMSLGVLLPAMIAIILWIWKSSHV